MTLRIQRHIRLLPVLPPRPPLQIVDLVPDLLQGNLPLAVLPATRTTVYSDAPHSSPTMWTEGTNTRGYVLIVSLISMGSGPALADSHADLVVVDTTPSSTVIVSLPVIRRHPPLLLKT